MIIVNTNDFPGKKIEVLGIVQGNIVNSKNVFSDLMAGLKTLVGHEIKQYTAMTSDSRAIATQRMIDEATEMGADAIINVRFTSVSVLDGCAEILAYGTAVKFLD